MPSTSNRPYASWDDEEVFNYLQQQVRYAEEFQSLIQVPEDLWYRIAFYLGARPDERGILPNISWGVFWIVCKEQQ